MAILDQFFAALEKVTAAFCNYCTTHVEAHALTAEENSEMHKFLFFIVFIFSNYGGGRGKKLHPAAEFLDPLQAAEYEKRSQWTPTHNTYLYLNISLHTFLSQK